MDVRCDRCQTEYEFDENYLTPNGVAVKCTTCGNVFKVRRSLTQPLIVTTPIPSSTSLPAASSQGESRLSLVRWRAGQTLPLKDVNELQRWVVERKVTRDDEVSFGGDGFRKLGNLPELNSFFQLVDAADRAQSQAPAPAPTAERVEPRPVPPPALINTTPGFPDAPKALGTPPLLTPEPAWTGQRRATSPMNMATLVDEELDEEVSRLKGSRIGIWLLLLILVGGGGGAAWWYLNNSGPPRPTTRPHPPPAPPPDPVAAPVPAPVPVETATPSGAAPATPNQAAPPSGTPAAAPVPPAPGGPPPAATPDPHAPLPGVTTAQPAAPGTGAPGTPNPPPNSAVAAATPTAATPAAAMPAPAPTLTPKAEAEVPPARGAAAAAAAAAQAPSTPPPAPPKTDFAGYMARGRHLMETRPIEALEMFKKASQLVPSSPEPYAARGLAYTDMQSWDAAIEAFNAALTRNPDYSDAVMGLAEAYRYKGDKEKAQINYQRYLQLAPSGPDARVARVQLEILKGNAPQ